MTTRRTDLAEDLRRPRSQSVILKRGQNAKYRPLAFTEHGAIMAASVLNSSKAVEMSVFVVRASVRLRNYARTHAELAATLTVLERKVAGHDEDLKVNKLPRPVAGLDGRNLPQPVAETRVREQQTEAASLDAAIAVNLKELGFGE